MAELRILQKKLQSVKALREIVDAMRNLAATYVRRAEKSMDAIRPYADVVETALQVTLDAAGVVDLEPTEAPRTVAVVFASDQGLCGPYNNHVVRKALQFGEETAGEIAWIAIGHRGYGLLAMRGVTPALSVPAPTSIEGIKAEVLDIAGAILKFYEEHGGNRLFFIYNAYEGLGRFAETARQVLPPKRTDIEVERPRSFASPPLLTAPPERLLGLLAQEYFFIQLYRGLLESHSSENGARLAAMTSASTNIDERLAELTKEFQTVRQDSITAELLDVVGGAEALK